MKYGLCLPIFANPGAIHFRTPGLKKVNWELIEKIAIYADKNNFNSLFIADHLSLGQNDKIYECMTTLSAIAAITENIKLFPIHLCNSFRNIYLCANQIMTIQDISKGRMGVFYDYGWREKEFNSYKYQFKNKELRISEMDESIGILKELLSENTSINNGTHPTIGFSKQSKTEIWMGEANNRSMVKSIVKYADVFNSMPCSVEGISEKIKTIYNEANYQSRDIESIGISLETQLLVRKSEKEVKDAIQYLLSLKKFNKSDDQDIITQLKEVDPDFSSNPSYKILQRNYLIGTPSQINDKITAYKNIGVQHFMLWPLDVPDFTSIKLFAEHFVNSK